MTRGLYRVCLAAALGFMALTASGSQVARAQGVDAASEPVPDTTLDGSGAAAPGAGVEGSGDTAVSGSEGSGDAAIGEIEGSGATAPSVESDPFEFREDDPDLPNLRLDAPDDEELAILLPLPEPEPEASRWIRQWGMVTVGVGGAEGEVANPHVILQWAAAIVDQEDDPLPLELHDVARKIWADLRLAAEIGGGAATSGLPTASFDLTVLTDRDAPIRRGTPASIDPRRIWAPLRLWRNVRLGRDVALALPAAGYALGVRWQDRPGVATHFGLRITSPGYAYQSAMGRAGAFHGAQLAGFGIEVGPTVRIGPRADFVWRIGASADLAIGADQGPRLSMRSSSGVHMQNAVVVLQRYRIDLLAGYSIASDSYYNVRREDWFVRVLAGFAF